MTAIDIDTAADRLADAPPTELLGWACQDIVGKIAFATGFGPEGCVLVDMISRASLPIDLFTLDTGLLFPETYELWRRLEARYGVTISPVRPAQTVSEQASSHGPQLWKREPDRCCELRKVAPLRAALAHCAAWVSGIRRDQTPERAHVRCVERDLKFGVIKINPLVAWTHDDVWAYVYAHDVPVNPLHERGYPSIGCEPCTSAIVPGEHLRAGRWRGANKTECGLHVAQKVGS